VLRCIRCRMHAHLCVCDLVPTLETRTRVVFVVHRSENRKSTNTARLAAACLANSHLVVRGLLGEPPRVAWDPASRPLVLFPSPDATTLTAGEKAPTTLIVPDGTWRQASKMPRRIPELRDVPCVALPPGPPSAYRLRRRPRETGLATIEAVARALGILEGPEIEAALDRVFRAMVERTLRSRGRVR
jgi:DTW domain-containing protein